MSAAALPLYRREPRGPLAGAPTVTLRPGPLALEDLIAVAHGAPVEVDPAARAALRGWDGPVLRDKRQWLVGAHAAAHPEADLPRLFILGHCAGVGAPLPREVVRAAIAARAQVLLQGCSGVRPACIDVLVDMLNEGVHPVVPAQGSVGAAGDLAPMAHVARVAAALDGPVPGLRPFSPTQKEALALINGVSLSCALAAVAVSRAERVLAGAVDAAAMSLEALRAAPGCLDPRALSLRGHPGVAKVGAALRARLEGSALVVQGRPPDAFSVRCAPQVLGAALDAAASARAVVEAELGAVSDNPLCLWPADGGAPELVEAGNFHGASLGLAMDHLKAALTQAATISERRTFRLTYGQLSSDLPSFLVPGTGLNSGFMLAQYTAASLASECKGLSHPASVDSIPTVQHHEDHVSMAPIAARTALMVIECVADIVAIEAMLAAQALDLRRRGLGEGGAQIAPAIDALRAQVRAVVNFWEDDGVMHPELAAAGALLRAGGLGVGPAAAPW